MVDAAHYEASFRRYSQRWTRIALLPWISVFLLAALFLVTEQWALTALVDQVAYLLFWSPVLAWALGRRDLGKQVSFDTLAAPDAGAHPLRTIYRTSTASGAWLVTGAAPRWGFAMAAVYAAFDVVWYAKTFFDPYLRLGRMPLSFGAIAVSIVGRLCFLMVWRTLVRFDASRVAVLQTSPSGARPGLVLRGLEDTWFASITRLDDDPRVLHLEMRRSLERWRVVGPVDDAALKEALASVQRILR
jgi:hypothetical protein